MRFAIPCWVLWLVLRWHFEHVAQLGAIFIGYYQFDQERVERSEKIVGPAIVESLGGSASRAVECAKRPRLISPLPRESRDEEESPPEFSDVGAPSKKPKSESATDMYVDEIAVLVAAASAGCSVVGVAIAKRRLQRIFEAINVPHYLHTQTSSIWGGV